MTVLVHGAGAVGSLFAARFAAAGIPVRLIGRPAHVEAIVRHGLQLEGVGAGTVRLAASSTIPPDLVAEAALLTVKTFDLGPAAVELGTAARPMPVLLPQNGLGIEPAVVAALTGAGWDRAADRVVRAVQSVPATLVRPGVVRAAGTGEVLLPRLGPNDPRQPAVARFAELFRIARVPVRTVDAFDREVWRKALVNAAINPVTALHAVPNGALAAGPLREEAHRLLDEAARVAAAAGAAIGPAEARADLDRVVRATAENRSSMLQDLERGRPTEIDAISGALLRIGAEHGLDLPATRSAIERVRAAAHGGAPAQPS